MRKYTRVWHRQLKSEVAHHDHAHIDCLHLRICCSSILLLQQYPLSVVQTWRQQVVNRDLPNGPQLHQDLPTMLVRALDSFLQLPLPCYASAARAMRLFFVWSLKVDHCKRQMAAVEINTNVLTWLPELLETWAREHSWYCTQLLLTGALQIWWVLIMSYIYKCQPCEDNRQHTSFMINVLGLQGSTLWAWLP